MKGLADRLGERYARDPAFHRMVDLMTMAVQDLHLAPSEVREAATYAIYREEMRVTNQTFVILEEDGRRDCVPLLTDHRIACLARRAAEGTASEDEVRAMAVEIQRCRATARAVAPDGAVGFAPCKSLPCFCYATNELGACPAHGSRR